MRAHRTLTAAHVAFLAMAVFALAQRPSVVDESTDTPSTVSRSQLVPHVALATSGVQLKRATWSSTAVPVVLPGLAPMRAGAHLVITQRPERSEATTSASRARLRAHPPSGPPAS